MKALNTDAVRSLYRGCYFPAEQTPHNFAEMTAVSTAIDTALKAFFSTCDAKQRKQLEAILRDLSELDDLCSEDAFVKGFASAVELFLVRPKVRPRSGVRRKKRRDGKGERAL